MENNKLKLKVSSFNALNYLKWVDAFHPEYSNLRDSYIKASDKAQYILMEYDPNYLDTVPFIKDGDLNTDFLNAPFEYNPVVSKNVGLQMHLDKAISEIDSKGLDNLLLQAGITKNSIDQTRRTFEKVRFAQIIIDELEGKPLDFTFEGHIVGPKIKWKGSSIQLLTLFYDLIEVTDLISKKEKGKIAYLIANNFESKDGEISLEYAKKALKPSGPKCTDDDRIDVSL